MFFNVWIWPLNVFWWKCAPMIWIPQLFTGDGSMNSLWPIRSKIIMSANFHQKPWWWLEQIKIYFYVNSTSKCECWEVRFTFIKNSFWKFHEEGSERLILILVDNDSQGYKLPCCGSFALGFSALIRFPLTMLWVNLLYFASMYFRSGTFKTSYLPKSYFMYLRLKMQVHVRNSSKNYKKSFLLFRHSNEFRLFGWIFWNLLYEKSLIQVSILVTKE